MTERLFIAICMAFFIQMARAQMPAGDSMAQRMGAENYKMDSTETGSLGVRVEATAFFKDNEFDGNVREGYTLPGVWLKPRLTYVPIPKVKLELGMYSIFYSGANKYPCYAYHDIAKWKGQQYTSGMHVLPFFRATARFKSLTLALGDIYGGTTHRLIEPMYNPELVLTADPEMGMQIIVDLKRWHSDLWIDWQSFIYKTDTHQEAFTIGWSQCVGLLCDRRNRVGGHSLYIPIQLVAQHRGGEQDGSMAGVQTLWNAAAGLGYRLDRSDRKAFTALDVEVAWLGCMRQAGKLWPFKKGQAVWAKVDAEFIHDLRVSAGFFTASRFCSLYGSPFYGTVSLKDGAAFGSVVTGSLGVEYSRTFAKRYTLGADVKAYLCSNGKFSTPFCFGAYFRVCPDFVIKRWRK